MALNDLMKKLIYGDDTDKDYEDAESGDYTDDDSYASAAQEQTQQSSARQSAHTGSYDAQTSSNVNMTSGTAIEMKVVKPDTLDTVTQIADSLLDRKTILLNLEDTSKETSRRLIDFLNGVAYAINGNLKKVATNTYVVTPNNVEVSGEQIRETQDKSELV